MVKMTTYSCKLPIPYTKLMKGFPMTNMRINKSHTNFMRAAHRLGWLTPNCPSSVADDEIDERGKGKSGSQVREIDREGGKRGMRRQAVETEKERLGTASACESG